MDVPNEPREFKDKSLNSPLKIGLYGVLCHNTGTTYYVLHNISTTHASVGGANFSVSCLIACLGHLCTKLPPCQSKRTLYLQMGTIEN